MTAGQKSFIHKALIILGIVALGASLRLYSLTSDPPDYLSWSAAVYVDEGYKALDARNTIKYGANRWSQFDEYGGHKESSRVIYTAQLWIFKHFGLSILNLRYFNVILSLCIIAIFLATISAYFPKRTVFLIGLALAINVIFLFHSRMALYEMPMIFFGVLLLPPMLYFSHGENFKSGARRWISAVFLAALVAVVTLVGMKMKGSFAIYMGSILAGFFFAVLVPYSRKRMLPRILELKNLFLAAIVCIFAISFILYTFQANLGFQVRYLGNPLILLGKIWFMEVIYLQPNTFIFCVLCVIAVLKILFSEKYVGYGNERLRQFQVDIFFTIQFLFSFIVVYMSSYSPLRYFLFCEIPMLYLAARFVGNYTNELKIIGSPAKKKRSPVASALIFLLVFYIIMQFIIFIVMLFVSYENRKIIFDQFYMNLSRGNLLNANAYYVFTLMLLVIPVVYYITKYFNDVVGFIKRHVSSKLMVFLLIEIQLIYLLSWQFNKTDRLRECMNYVNSLPGDSVIIGDWAPMVAFESDMRIIYSNPDDRRNVRNIAKLRPDYVVVKSNKNEEDTYNHYDPGLVDRDNFLYGFYVQGFDIRIYRVDKYRKK